MPLLQARMDKSFPRDKASIDGREYLSHSWVWAVDMLVNGVLCWSAVGSFVS